METLLFYFLKVILCSAVMFLYYRIFLKDKTFHHYNRFYLLGTLVVSLLLPLLKVDYFTINVNQNIYELLLLLQNNPTSNISSNDFSIYPIIFAILALVAVFFVAKFGFALWKINQFKKEYPEEKLEGISFYMTNLENAPFSFFRNLFWKNSILLQSDLGKQILKHEMVHIEQKHSYDKLFIEILTAVFWFNPIFYFIKKELNLIHEYLADKKALKNSDTKAFAQMLLETHFSGTILPGTSPFLNSNLKKRIIMLKKSNTKFAYFRKVFALPLLFLLFFVYMVKAKNTEIQKTNKMVEEMTNFYSQKSTLDTIKPIKKVEINTELTTNGNSQSIDLPTGEKLKKDEFPNPMTINLYRSSDDNMFVISGKEVSKKEFVDYFVKYNANSDYYFGSTTQTFNELETAGKMASFSAGKNSEMQKDQDFLFGIFKKYRKPNSAEMIDHRNKSSDIFPVLSADKASETITNSKFLDFFLSAEKDRTAYNQKRKERKAKMEQEIKKSNEKHSSNKNFYEGRDFDKVPLTLAEKEILKKQAAEIEKIRLKYEADPDATSASFIAFKPEKNKEIVFDINGNQIKDSEVSNDQLLIFPNFGKNSEFFIDGKKVSKETVLKLSEDLFAVKDFFKNKPVIKTLKRETVTNGKDNYLMKLEIFTK